MPQLQDTNLYAVPDEHRMRTRKSWRNMVIRER